MTEFERFSIAVGGGSLAGGVWHARATGPVVLAVHGITATHRTWPLLADALGDVRIIAPDLRGRGRSNALPGPFGLRAHAEDMLAVLRHFDVDRAIVVGHSMGAFVSVRLAELAPDRVEALVLVDGGLPVPHPPGVDRADVPAVVLGPALERLAMTFPDRASYRAFWRRHPALGPYWNDTIAAYVDYDVDGVEPELRSSALAEAVAENVLQLDGSDSYADALAGLTMPLDFFRAPRGLLDAAPLYPSEVVADWQRRLDRLRVHEVDDVNHYTVVMSQAGTEAIVPTIRRRLTEARTKEIAP
jgi:lipase